MDDITKWIDKYKPTSLDNMVLNKHTRKHLQYVLDNPCSAILHGPPGTGKGTFYDILKQNPDFDFLHKNAAVEGKIDDVRNEIQSYCMHVPSFATVFSVKRSYLVYNEAEKLSIDAQKALREAEEKYAAIFFFMTNDISNMDAALLDRFEVVEMLGQSHEDIVAFCNMILEAENATIDRKMLNKIINKRHPSIRKIINELKRNSECRDRPEGTQGNSV